MREAGAERDLAVPVAHLARFGDALVDVLGELAELAEGAEGPAEELLDDVRLPSASATARSPQRLERHAAVANAAPIVLDHEDVGQARGARVEAREIAPVTLGRALGGEEDAGG